jgi:hypothetical protein
VKKDKKEKPIPVFRDELILKEDDIIPQEGMQQATLLSDANITIIGGNRGGGKSFALVLDPLYDIGDSRFTAMMIRKETDQLEKGGGLYDKATKIYELLGAKCIKLKITFPSGAKITFDHINNESVTEVEKRFKGLEVPAMYVDELDQFQFPTFLKLMQSNRNSVGIRNRIIGTCNPNPSSWLRTFLTWYISEDGTIDTERDRKMRYFYVYGKSVNDIIWGNTKEEVYESAKYYIDRLWNPKFEESGLSKFDMIKSLKFIKGDVAENKILLTNDTSYLANIAMGGAEATARNIEGNWDILDDGEEMVTRAQMDMMFDEGRPALRTGKKHMSIDVALLGVDNFVVIVWDGLHIEDVFIKKKITSTEALEITRGFLNEYGVLEKNLVYDYCGNGQALNDLKSAYPVKPQSPPVGKESNYDNIKSQILYSFGRYLQEGKITCSPTAASKMFEYGKGTKKSRMSFKDILQNERRALMIADSTGKTKMLSKLAMKKILGGISPDFLEAVAYRVVFELDKSVKKGFTGLENL